MELPTFKHHLKTFFFNQSYSTQPATTRAWSSTSLTPHSLRPPVPALQPVLLHTSCDHPCLLFNQSYSTQPVTTRACSSTSLTPHILRPPVPALQPVLLHTACDHPCLLFNQSYFTQPATTRACDSTPTLTVSVDMWHVKSCALLILLLLLCQKY